MPSETPERGLDKASQTRRSDRISIRIPLSVVASDLSGRDAIEGAFTHTVTRYGASIVTKLGLVPGQEITLSRSNAVEAQARVIGQMGVHAEGAVYGIAFLDPNIEFWGIHFPPLEEDILAKVLLECLSCGGRSIVSLNEVEMEVFHANQRLTRHCGKCRDLTTWRQAKYEGEAEAVLRAPESLAARGPIPETKPRPTANRRAHGRVNVSVKACIQQARGAEQDIAVVLDMSRGGIRIRSSSPYEIGSRVLVAAPYTEGAANILVPARVVRRKEVAGAYEYGIKYVKD